jgi:hypothetical protein
MNRLIPTLLIFLSMHLSAQTEKDGGLLKQKHTGWVNCFVIKPTNDTLYGRIKYKDDYSYYTNNFAYSSILIIALNDDSEVKFNPVEIKELNLYNHVASAKKYISIGAKKNYKLYRVIIDGPCQLVYNQYEIMGNPATIEQTFDRYYVYYKNNLSPALEETSILNFPISIKKKCIAIFAECPQVVAKFSTDNYKDEELMQVVKAFNKCMEKSSR